MKLQALRGTKFEDFVEKTSTFYIILNIYNFDLSFELDLIEIIFISSYFLTGCSENQKRYIRQLNFALVHKKLDNCIF